MTSLEQRGLRLRLEWKIKHEVPDPAGWLLALRRFAEGLGLEPATCIPLGVSLSNVCHEVVEHAGKQRLAVTTVRDAIEAIAAKS